jgi:hypothetical protein
MKKPEDLKKRNDRLSLYDLETPAVRKGISGWKLTKRPMQPEGPETLGLGIFGNNMDQSMMMDSHQEPSRKKSKQKKRRNNRPGDVTVDGRKI